MTTTTATPIVVTVRGQEYELEDAREFARELTYAADSVTPASDDATLVLKLALRTINKASGTTHTLESIAAACNVDLERATDADVDAMCAYIGGTILAA